MSDTENTTPDEEVVTGEVETTFDDAESESAEETSNPDETAEPEAPSVPKED